MGMGLNLHRNRIPSGVGRKEVLEEKGSGNPVFVSPSTTGINADFRLEAVLLGSSCNDVQGLPRQAPPLRRGWGGGGTSNHGSTVHSVPGAFRRGHLLSWHSNSPSRAALWPSGRSWLPAVWLDLGASSGRL